MSDTVAVSNVSKWFGFKVAVSEVTIGFGPGVTGLLGPNGAGKTTLMRLVAGLQRPSQGRIEVLGVDPRLDAGVYRDMSLVPEEEAVYQRLTATQFVKTMAALSKVENPAQAASRVLEIVNLSDDSEREVGGFSKGMRQRVKVAAALVTDPKVLVLDEPLNGADPVQRAELIRLFKDLGQQGKTLIVSSHILGEVERMADRVVAMVDGRLAAVGGVSDIRSAMTDRPRQVFIECSDPRQLGGALMGTEGVVGVHLDGENLRVEASDAGALSLSLPGIAVEKGILLSSVRPSDESLESVFRYLVANR